MITLKRGMNCKEVSIVKYLTGFSDIKQATNEFNDEFYKFVCEYQEKNNLAADGIIGRKTYQVIAEHAPTTSIFKNRKSREACALQVLFDLTVDGIYGSKTKAAVKDYQNQHNLKVDGVAGRETWTMVIVGETGKVPSGDLNPNAVQPVNFKQGDSRWGKKMYSNHGDKSQTMATSGCGPTSASDIVHQWWDNSITPYDMALKALDWGCRTKNSGTTGSFFFKVANLYKASKYSTTSNIDNAIKCLNEGGYVVVCFGPGTKGKPWYQLHTKGGHYCVLWKWDGEYFYINDPASSKAARAKSCYEDVKDCRKGFYCFWK